MGSVELPTLFLFMTKVLIINSNAASFRPSTKAKFSQSLSPSLQFRLGITTQIFVPMNENEWQDDAKDHLKIDNENISKV